MYILRWHDACHVRLSCCTCAVLHIGLQICTCVVSFAFTPNSQECAHLQLRPWDKKKRQTSKAHNHLWQMVYNLLSPLRQSWCRGKMVVKNGLRWENHVLLVGPYPPTVQEYFWTNRQLQGERSLGKSSTENQVYENGIAQCHPDGLSSAPMLRDKKHRNLKKGRKHMARSASKEA